MSEDRDSNVRVLVSGVGSDGFRWQALLRGDQWEDATIEVWSVDAGSNLRSERVGLILLSAFEQELDCVSIEVDDRRLFLGGVAPVGTSFVVVSSDPPYPRCVSVERIDWIPRPIWTHDSSPSRRIVRLRALDATGDTLLQREPSRGSTW